MSIPHADDLDDLINGSLYKEAKTQLSKEISQNIDYLKDGEKLNIFFTYYEGDEDRLYDALKKIAKELESKNYKTKLEKVWEAHELTIWRGEKEKEEEEELYY